MFRPFRTLLFAGILLIAGYAYATIRHSERCAAAGGAVVAGLCTGERP